MDLSVIILSFNTKDILRNCLKSVFENLQNINAEVIVVDNNSEDGSKEMVKKEFPQIKLIKNDKNLGFTKGNNQGINESKGRYVLLLNSDTLINNDPIKKMVEFMDSNLEIGVLGPKILNADGSDQFSVGKFPSLPVVFIMLFLEHFGVSRYVRTSYDKAREVDWMMGAALLIRKSILNRTGLFDEDIFMYYDEVEWCYRIKEKGFKIYFFPEYKITHLWQKSSQTGRGGPIIANYKGLIHFYKKHKNPLELSFLKFLLKTKAIFSLFIGYITNNCYLKETYEKAYKLV